MTKARSAVQCAVVVCLVAVGAQASNQISDAGAVSGRTVDATSGAGVVSALVSFVPIDRPGDGYQVWTDDRGRFVHPAIAPGEYRVTAGKPGYFQPSVVESLVVVVAPKQWVSDIRIGLVPMSSISGSVVGASDEPLAGVVVRTFRLVPVAGRLQMVAGPTDTTDDRGQYRMSGLRQGAYTVAAVGRRLVSGTADTDGDEAIVFFPAGQRPSEAQSIEIDAGRDVSGVDLRVQRVPTWGVSGVIEPARTGAVEVRLIAGGCGETHAACEIASTRTDPSGRFDFSAVPIGQYILVAGSVAGALQLAPPEVVASASAAASILGTNRASLQGSGVIRALPGGLLAQVSRGSDDNGMNGRLDVNVVDRDLVAPSLQMTPLVSVAGRVVWSDGQPAPSLQTRVFVDPALGVGAVVDADGGGLFAGMSMPGMQRPRGGATDDASFRISAVGAGNYFFRVRGEQVVAVLVDGVDYVDRPISIGSGYRPPHVEIVVARTRHVLRGRLSQPSDRRSVMAFPVSTDKWRDFGLFPANVQIATPKHDGTFEMRLPPDDYYLAAVPVSEAEGCLIAECFTRLAATATRVTVISGVAITSVLVR